MRHLRKKLQKDIQHKPNHQRMPKMQAKNKKNEQKMDWKKMSELTDLWKNTPELQQIFGSEQSFYGWYGKNIHPLANPTVEEMVKKAKKRFLCGNDRVKFNKRHNITRDK